MSQYPEGPLPDGYKEEATQLIREVGLAAMTMPVLVRRLSAKFNVDFKPHEAEVTVFVTKLMQTPEMRRQLAQVQQDAETGAGGKGKRARSASKGTKGTKGSKEGKEKKEKKEKKPEDYPKGALSPYIIFAGAFRDSHKDLAVKDQMRQAGEAWKLLSAEEKKTYEAKGAADKERFERDMAAYVAKGGVVLKRCSKTSKGGHKVKKAKDPNAPKRALSGYMFFAAHFRDTHKDMQARDQMRLAGETWKKMNDAEKQPFEAKAAADKERYVQECATKGYKAGSSAAPKAGKKADAKDAASSSDSSSDSDSSSSSSSSSDSDDE